MVRERLEDLPLLTEKMLQQVLPGVSVPDLLTLLGNPYTQLAVAEKLLGRSIQEDDKKEREILYGGLPPMETARRLLQIREEADGLARGLFKGLDTSTSG